MVWRFSTLLHTSILGTKRSDRGIVRGRHPDNHDSQSRGGQAEGDRSKSEVRGWRQSSLSSGRPASVSYSPAALFSFRGGILWAARRGPPHSPLHPGGSVADTPRSAAPAPARADLGRQRGV